MARGVFFLILVADTHCAREGKSRLSII